MLAISAAMPRFFENDGEDQMCFANPGLAADHDHASRGRPDASSRRNRSSFPFRLASDRRDRSFLACCRGGPALARGAFAESLAISARTSAIDSIAVVARFLRAAAGSAASGLGADRRSDSGGARRMAKKTRVSCVEGQRKGWGFPSNSQRRMPKEKRSERWSSRVALHLFRRHVIGGSDGRRRVRLMPGPR